MRRKRPRDSSRSGPSYESPLNCFKESLEEVTSVLADFVNNGEMRLTRGMLRKYKQEVTDRIVRSPSRNSVIVINDSDNENASLSVIECSPNQSLPLQKSPKKSKCTSKQTNRASVISLDSSVVCSSSTQELNGENIAPSQKEDDVIELWSCLKDSSKVNENKGNADCNATNDVTKGILDYVIDTTPDLRNLEYLNTDTEPVKKKRKKHRDLNKIALHHDKSTKHVKLKHSSKSKKREKYDNSASSSSSDKKSDKESDKKSNKTESEKSKSEESKSDETDSRSNHKLREIIVDGCNVAMSHTNGATFSEKGIKLVIDYFKLRGHTVKVFLPQHVRRREYTFLEKLYKEGTVVFTPSRYIAGRYITPYDDRYILEYATSCKGIVISSDQYRDLYREKPSWRDTILNRLLSPTFVGDYIMFPEDPLGKSGPNLDTFLRLT